MGRKKIQKTVPWKYGCVRGQHTRNKLMYVFVCVCIHTCGARTHAYSMKTKCTETTHSKYIFVCVCMPVYAYVWRAYTHIQYENRMKAGRRWWVMNESYHGTWMVRGGVTGIILSQCMNGCALTCIFRSTENTGTHMCIHACIHTWLIQTHKHTRINDYIHTHTYILLCTYSYTQTLEHTYIPTYKHTYAHANTVRHTYMPAPYTQTQTSEQKSAGYIDHVSISVRVYICLRVSMYCRTQRWCTFSSTSLLFFHGIQVKTLCSKEGGGGVGPATVYKKKKREVEKSQIARCEFYLEKLTVIFFSKRPSL